MTGLKVCFFPLSGDEGSCFPTLATKTKTSRGWGIRLVVDRRALHLWGLAVIQ